jgi:hypothetical protein
MVLGVEVIVRCCLLLDRDGAWRRRSKKRSAVQHAQHDEDAAQVGEVSTVVLIPKYTQWDRRIFVTSRGTSGGKDFSREILHHMRLPAISPIPH